MTEERKHHEEEEHSKCGGPGDGACAPGPHDPFGPGAGPLRDGQGPSTPGPRQGSREPHPPGGHRPGACVEPGHSDREAESPDPALLPAGCPGRLHPDAEQHPGSQQLQLPVHQPAGRGCPDLHGAPDLQHVDFPDAALVRRSAEHQFQQRPHRDEQRLLHPEPKLQLHRQLQLHAAPSVGAPDGQPAAVDQGPGDPGGHHRPPAPEPDHQHH